MSPASNVVPFPPHRRLVGELDPACQRQLATMPAGRGRDIFLAFAVLVAMWKASRLSGEGSSGTYSA